MSSAAWRKPAAVTEAAPAFYTGRLGVGTASVHGEPPVYAQVRRSGALLLFASAA